MIMKLHDSVRIKSTGHTGVIVDFDNDHPNDPIQLVELNDTDVNDKLEWVEADDLDVIPARHFEPITT